MKKIKFTEEGLIKVKREYEELINRRPAAVMELSRARELGDLSENGLYHATKATLRSIDSRLRRLSNQIKLASIVPSRKFVVQQNGKEVIYEIVGDFEADPKQFKLSSNSPIGSSLMNMKAGETTKIQTPNGTLELRILKVL